MEVITDPEVDAVWICSPSSFHAEQIKACAANKKHVFCEKPIATELTETVEAINACNAAGVKLMIGLQRRFDQNFKRVQVAVQRKEVGTPIMIKLCSRDPSPPPYSYVKVSSHEATRHVLAYRKRAYTFFCTLLSLLVRVEVVSLPTWPCTIWT
jgi:myo-inositol 2-dehydrogenase / D-chiro-inositol 1-dehydrogenase